MANKERAKYLFEIIKNNPGLTSRELGKIMGKNSRHVLNILPSLEADGLLVSEDDIGRLFPLEIKYD